MAAASTGSGELAQRYALALIDLADEKKALDEVASDFHDLRAMIAESEDLRTLLETPVLEREAQSKGLQSLANQAGFGPLTRNFLNLVAANGRAAFLAAMIDAYLAELARRRGEVKAEVTVAQSLTDQQQSALTDAIKRVVGGAVSIDLKVDPSLLGGMVVKVGSRMMDSSLRSKMQRLQFAMKGIG